jgi:DNA-binding CsgD family transcriptional regulator
MELARMVKMTLKKCSKCNRKKELSYYPKRRDSIDGLRSYCKECHNRTQTGKICKECKIVTKLSEFYSRSDSRDGLRYECKKCTREASARYILTPKGKKVMQKSAEKYHATPAGKEKNKRGYIRFKEKRAILLGKKKECLKCNTIKDITEYYMDKTKNLGVTSYCKICRKKAASLFRKTPAGKVIGAKSSKKYSLTERGKEVKRKISKKYYLKKTLLY